MHVTSLRDVGVYLLWRWILLPLHIAAALFSLVCPSRRRAPRSVYVAEAAVQAGETRPIRNARAVERLETMEGVTTMREVGDERRRRVAAQRSTPL